MSGNSSEDGLRPLVAQDRGGGKPLARALRRLHGTAGALAGPKGSERRIFWTGWAAIAFVVACFNSLSIISNFHDRPDIAWQAPVVWEVSSWLTFSAFCGIVWLALKVAPLESRPRWRIAAIHLPAFLLFSVLHIGGFVALRKLAYMTQGAIYDFSPWYSEYLYELRKDAFGYILCLLNFWIARRILEAPEAARDSGTFDIRDGARLIRAALPNILAVTSAGNYAEFVLADGRRPLMRTTLSALEQELGPRGFVRTHRSWLVNRSVVTGLKPEGSGDYTVELGQAVAPLSRRFPEALAKLRGE